MLRDVLLLVNDFIGEILKTCNDIYRMKGVLSIAGSAEKFVYQGVHMIFDGEFQSAWAAGERRCSTLVFIGKNLDKAALEKSFRECLVTPENQARIAAIERVQSMERKGKELLGAAHRDDVRAIQAIVAAGCDPNWGNVLGQTALHIAGIWGNASAMKQLVACGANVNSTNGDRLGRQTPLHMVASRNSNPGNRLICAQFLVAQGADRSMEDLGGQTPVDVLGDDAPVELRAALSQ